MPLRRRRQLLATAWSIMAATLSMTMAATVLMACGGAQGFEQTTPRVDPARAPVVTDTEVQRALGVQAQLPRPYRVGVFFRDPITDDGTEPQWRWTLKDKKTSTRSI